MRNEENGYYRITPHAMLSLNDRWPDTVLRPQDFASIRVPLSAPVVGYDPRSSAKYVLVPGTPMVALVQATDVVTFLAWDQAAMKLSIRGYWFGYSGGPQAA